jgi:hypothetical protein
MRIENISQYLDLLHLSVIITVDKHINESLYPEREVQILCVNETALH